MCNNCRDLDQFTDHIIHDGLHPDDVFDIYESKNIFTAKGDLPGVGDIASTDDYKRSRRSLGGSALKSLERQKKAFIGDMVQLWHDRRQSRFSASIYRDSAKKILKDYYTKAYLLGIKSSGVRKGAMPEKDYRLSQEDQNWINSAYRQELRFFNKAISVIADQESEDYTRRRVKAYSDSLTYVFEGAKVRYSPSNSIIYWRLGEAEHCPSCIYLQSLSPYTRETLPTTPKAGMTLCLHNCKCKLVVQNVSSDRYERVRSSNKSPKTVHRELLRIKRKRK